MESLYLIHKSIKSVLKESFYDGDWGWLDDIVGMELGSDFEDLPSNEISVGSDNSDATISILKDVIIYRIPLDDYLEMYGEGDDDWALNELLTTGEIEAGGDYYALDGSDEIDYVGWRFSKEQLERLSDILNHPKSRELYAKKMGELKSDTSWRGKRILESLENVFEYHSGKKIHGDSYTVSLDSIINSDSFGHVGDLADCISDGVWSTFENGVLGELSMSLDRNRAEETTEKYQDDLKYDGVTVSYGYYGKDKPVVVVKVPYEQGKDTNLTNIIEYLQINQIDYRDYYYDIWEVGMPDISDYVIQFLTDLESGLKEKNITESTDDDWEWARDLPSLPKDDMTMEDFMGILEDGLEFVFTDTGSSENFSLGLYGTKLVFKNHLGGITNTWGVDTESNIADTILDNFNNGSHWKLVDIREKQD